MASRERLDGAQFTEILIPRPHKGYFVNGEQALLPREIIADLWRRMPATFLEYDEGYTESGLHYARGRRLIVGGKEIKNSEGKLIDVLGGEHVMDTCEYPVIRKVVEKTIEITGRGPGKKYLILGAGLHLATNELYSYMDEESLLIVVELNRKVASDAKRHATILNESQMKLSKFNPSFKSKIIEVREGDAWKVLAELSDERDKEGEPIKFDAIIADTYPFIPADMRDHDLKMIPAMINVLAVNGVIAPFTYFLGSGGALTRAQRGTIDAYFKDSRVTTARIQKVPGYEYLKDETGDYVDCSVAVAYNPRPIPILDLLKN